MSAARLRADFNGVFGDLLCLSHGDSCRDEFENEVMLTQGMIVTAFEENYEGGVRDDLLATGVVEPSPDWLQCNGSKWALRLDERGVRWQSDEGNT
jgi:hypothetical protein